MERLQGPINPCFLGEHLEVEYLEQGFVNSERLRFGVVEEEEEAHFLIPSLEDKIPFLQMLQCAESPQVLAFKEPNFQKLLRLQNFKKPWEINNNNLFIPEMETLELECCVTHEILDLHSPVKSETKELNKSSCFEIVSSESNQDQLKSATTADNCSGEGHSAGSSAQKNYTKSRAIARERRKRKRTRPSKNKEEVESQRMTHIAVERNRRRQMNDYLNSLRSLMPASYIQRSDQASIIGGAIDFVKELEQLLQSLEAQKRMTRVEESKSIYNLVSKSQPESGIGSENGNCGEEVKAETKPAGEAKPEIEVNVIHNHVNLKIRCSRRLGQLLQAIVTLESLRLTVLHLNITSSQVSVLYSFNLKMEDDCKLRSADEIAAAVHQIFS